MNRPILIALAAGTALLSTPVVFAAGQSDEKPPMHMHKSEMDHRSDKEVAKEYTSEAAQLREKAEHHRKLARLYQDRQSPKGASYATVAKHCEKLAKFYDEAAKEAEGVSTELSK